MRYKAKLEKMHSALKNTDNEPIDLKAGGDVLSVDRKDAKPPKDSSPLF